MLRITRLVQQLYFYKNYAYSKNDRWMTNITLRAFSAEVTYYICLSWRIEWKINRPFPKLYYFNLKIRPNLRISTLLINLVAWIEGVFLKAFPGRINMFRDSQTLILMFAALKKLNNFIYCYYIYLFNNLACPFEIVGVGKEEISHWRYALRFITGFFLLFHMTLIKI